MLSESRLHAPPTLPPSIDTLTRSPLPFPSTLLLCCSQIIEAPTSFDEAEASASDNAVSALGKLCRRSEAIAAGALPRWLAKLPLQADREEARAVHKTLVDMCEATNPHLLAPTTSGSPRLLSSSARS